MSRNQSRHPHRPLVAKALLIAVSAGALLGVSQSRERLEQIPEPVISAEEPPIFLPDVHRIKLLTLGFDGPASKLLWFQTINYFGRELGTRRDFRWLGEMCELVTTLDPHARHAVEFCATLLSWVAQSPQDAAKILDAAVEAEPDYWRYRYLRGFNSYYFLHDFESAKSDFTVAGKLPGTPPHVMSLASRLLADRDGPEMAIRFLEDMLSRTTDETVKKQLGSRWKRARIARDFQVLTDARKHYIETKGSAPQSVTDLVTSGILSALPQEPYKGSYFFDEAGQPQTTSGKKPLAFDGKTSETGLAALEKKNTGITAVAQGIEGNAAMSPGAADGK